LISEKRPSLTIRMLIIILNSLFIQYKGQVNYVQNPSFEDLDSCNSLNFNYPPRHWDTLRAGGGGGPEACTPCAILAITRVPTNGYAPSFQIPRTGNKYVFYSNYIEIPVPGEKEYIQNELIDTLKPNENYCVTFYLSLMNESKYAITEFGAYLDNGTVSSPYYGTATVTPQIKSSPGVLLTDTLGWIKVQGKFLAQGNEKYLTLGNFKSNASTTFSIMGGPRLVADYYVDDVSVIEANLPAYAGPDTVLCIGDSVFIGRTPEVGLECVWSSNSSTNTTGGGFWVKPSSTQTFAVQQEVCGVFTFDTIQVQIKPKYIDASTLTANYTSLCFKDSLKLNLLNPPIDADTKYQWEGPNGLNNYTISNPKGIIQQGATYSLSYGSSGSSIHCPFIYNKSISIELKDTCDADPIFPNIFTPNNDGVNDVWRINYSKVSYVKEITYSIYNRWGNIIFEGSRANMWWDGYTTSGIQCTDGVYFYVVKIRDVKDQEKSYKGNITLVR